ncbi:MAG: hypothetical protein M1426_00155 [Patescibacteria group bacterium]|nr:hypothetical protein [Patescibacteria group bacterium]
MAAANTDLFKKLARRWVGQIGAGGVSDASVTTVPLSSATNLPADTAIGAVIDRVDANGTTTASKEETIIGVVSGSNLVSCVRGVEGTAQAHDAGAVVEILFSNKVWGDLIDGILVGHTQLGAHIASLPLTTPKIASLYQDAGASNLLTMPAATDTLVGKATTDTLTNKRITKRITTITSSATPTVNTDNCDVVTITAQAEAITSMTSGLSGTPTNFQSLIYRILDNGTNRAITWGTSFVAKGVALPTTTTASKLLTVGFIYNTVTSKWECVASATES